MHSQLIEQARTFPERIVEKRDDFAKFAKGQHPDTLFITCSDSRIVPTLITESGPGELFELRNAGNIVQPYDGLSSCAESATIEYAVEVLKVSDIVLCGHSHCGAVGAMLRREQLGQLPAIERWLYCSGSPASIAPVEDTAETDEELVASAAQQHLTIQMRHLLTHPGVQRGIADERLRVHAWFYEVHTGAVRTLQGTSFEPL